MLFAGGDLTLSGGVVINLGTFAGHCNGNLLLSASPNVTASGLSACGTTTLSGNPTVNLTSGKRRELNALFALKQIREGLRQRIGVVEAKSECEGIAEEDDRAPAVRRKRPAQEIRIEGIVSAVDRGARLGIEARRMVDPGLAAPQPSTGS